MQADQSQAASAAGDSMTVAAWTMLSRITGLVRFAVVGAVLGPTFFGNTYQFTNSLPNLVYYGFLAGSLFSSLLVPALVRHIDSGDRRASERVAGGFLGVTLVALLPLVPLAVVLGPLALRVAALGGPHAVSAIQAHVGRLLILMFIPQMFCYGIIGTATAVMYSRRRFALAAGAPAIENLGTIAVLLVTAALYGTGRDLTDVPAGELALLGFGSTGAVVLHAATQWWGAKRAGVVLLPRPGWRDPEVQTVIKRAVPALGQDGLSAVQTLTLLTLANRVPGGVVAFQIALNFYYLANNIGTAPVALSLLPRLARMHLDGEPTAFRDTLVRGFALGFFVAIPAAVGYVVLAIPLARAVSFGRMDSTAGVTMIAAALVPLSVAVISETAFQISTCAFYARKDTRSPLRSTALGAVLCLGLVGIVPFVHGTAVLFTLGAASSASLTAAACHLTSRMRQWLGPPGHERLIPSIVRFIAGAVAMAGPAWLTAAAAASATERPLVAKAGIVAATITGAAVYLAIQALFRTPEVGWLIGGLAHMRGNAGRAVGEWTGTYRGPRRRSGPESPAGRWDRRLLRPVSSRWLIGPALLAAAGAAAVSVHRPVAAVAGLLALAVMACVWRWPSLAAYLAIGLTPLTVSLNLGNALPLIRPNEAIDLLLGAALISRGIALVRSGGLPRIRLNRVEAAMVAMAVANSVVPLLWAAVRHQPISQDDFLYALVMWKLLGLYALVRASVSTQQQIRRCLWISVTVACVVAVVAVLESLALAGVPRLLAQFFGAYNSASGPAGGRGSSLLGLPAATADLMIVNLAVISGLWTCYRRHRLILTAAAVLMVFGVISAGEFSSAMGLVVGVACIALVYRSPRLLGLFALAATVGGIILWPVISQRLLGFQSASGLPVSWTGRLYNLRTYFWPTLFSDWNWVLGVRTAARVPVPTQDTGYVWIESGYTWLLWGGGIPLLASYVFFTVVTAQAGWHAARSRRGAQSAAGVAVFTAVVVIALLMTFDPHLTYRGSADDFFFLIALAVPRTRRPAGAGRRTPCATHSRGNDGGWDVMLDKGPYDDDGHWHHPATHNGGIQGTKLARLRSRQLGHDPGEPGSWPRFLVAHARWILGVTLAAVAVAAMFTFTQTRLYASEAEVVVQPAPAVAGTSAQQPDMSTETGVAASGVVLSRAARAVGAPVAELRNGLSVKAQGAGYVLQIAYSAADPRTAQQRAQAIAQAYTSFRSASSGPRSPQSTSPTATLITPASLPADPYSPDYLLDIGAALLIGLAIAIATAWGRDYMDDRLRGPLDLERQVGADVLGMIPAFRPAKREPRGQLAVAASPGSMVAEAYRALRTRVLLTAASRNSGTILVTSAVWEDRGTVAANLAAALAQSGRSTVLVCAGHQWDRAQLLLGVQEEAEGLTEVLEKRTDPLGALQATSIPGLRLLPPGAVPRDPAALLQPALRAALSEIRAHADVVVVEAPPVLFSPDARLLAGCAGMILLIADARASTRAQVRAAVRELEQERARLAGCVLVNVGRRLRLRPGYPPSAQAVDDRSRSAPAGSDNADLAPMPGTAPAGPGSQTAEERQWPNDS